MHPKLRLASPGVYLSIGLLWASAACDPQFSPEFIGEPLFTLTGSVEITERRTQGRLIPALAFGNPQGTVDIVEVEVRGEFPSDFRLDVYERPPQSAFFAAGHIEGEPRIALGYITAVSPRHPDTIRFAVEQMTFESAGCLDPDCSQTCESAGVECRPRRNQWCTADGDDCYEETSICPTLDSSDPACRIESKGDPSLKEEPWTYFAGFSQNYVVIYLESKAKAGSWTAARLGAPEGLPAGYGLFAVRMPTTDEIEAVADCPERVEARSVEMYNAKYGTDYTSLGPDACLTCAAGTCDGPPLPKFCSGTLEEIEHYQAEYDRFRELSQLELGCAGSALVPTRVEDPARESVSVRIGSDSRPQF